MCSGVGAGVQGTGRASLQWLFDGFGVVCLKTRSPWSKAYRIHSPVNFGRHQQSVWQTGFDVKLTNSKSNLEKTKFSACLLSCSRSSGSHNIQYVQNSGFRTTLNTPSAATACWTLQLFHIWRSQLWTQSLLLKKPADAKRSWDFQAAKWKPFVFTGCLASTWTQIFMKRGEKRQSEQHVRIRNMRSKIPQHQLIKMSVKQQ